jgi:hypothetical protein
MFQQTAETILRKKIIKKYYCDGEALKVSGNIAATL